MHDIDPGLYSDDNTIPEDSSAARWSDIFYEGCAKINHRIPHVAEYKTLMEEAGFVDIRVKILRRPTNTWPKDKRLKRIGLVRISYNKFSSDSLPLKIFLLTGPSVHTHEPP